MKSDYITRAKKFVEELYPYISNCKILNDYIKAVKKFNEENHRRVSLAHGISRMAFITSDYVIKVDYASEDAIEYYGGCENEVELYEFAKEYNFEYLFAAITKFTFKRKNYYIMPRIKGIGSAEHYIEYYLSEEEEEFLNNVVCDLHEDNFGFDKYGRPIIIDYACKPSASSW